MADAQVAEVRRLIDGLRRDRRRHPYSGRREYSERARAVAAAISEMIEAGGAAEAVPLARRAVERVTAAMMYMDDSSGIVGGDLRTLMALYAQAYRAVPRLRTPGGWPPGWLRRGWTGRAGRILSWRSSPGRWGMLAWQRLPG